MARKSTPAKRRKPSRQPKPPVPEHWQERLWDLVQNPPPGSKIEAAKRFGIDLTLNLHSLALSPTQRSQELQQMADFVEQYRGAAMRGAAKHR